MSSGLKAAIVVLILLVVPTLSFVGCGISVYNSEVSLREDHNAQEDVNRIVFEKFQKIVVEKAGVVKASVEAQKELFGLIMNSKSGGGGSLMNFIHEHNPNPDAALTETSKQFRDIMVSIEGLREEFARAQKRSREIEANHTKLLKSFVSSQMVSLFGGDMTPLETQIITSTRTEEVFTTGIDDQSLDPFNTLEKK